MIPGDARRPYVWVTWITGFLANTEQCRWKPWVKAHYKIKKGNPVETEDQVREGAERMREWTANHDAMTERRAALLRQEGRVVLIEDQNKFKLVGKLGDLAGKADLISIDEPRKEALIVDEKSGKEKPEHFWQVLVYILAFSLTKLKDYRISGELEYTSNSIKIPPDQLSDMRKQQIFETLRWVTGPVEPPRKPSIGECRYCDVFDCPDRIKPETQVAELKNYF